jgi:hypothetical protein
VEGQDGIDKLLFNGANIAENIDISANGAARALHPRHRRHHDGPERRGAHRLPRALGGADNVVVGDLTGTGVTEVDVDLRLPVAAAAATAPSTRSPCRRRRATTLQGHRRHGGLHVTGLAAATEIVFQESATGWCSTASAGDDVDRCQRPAGRRRVADAQRRPRCDTLIGSKGGGRDHRRRWQTTWRSWAPATTPSSGTRATTTTSSKARTASTRCMFNGANIAENIDISANGARARFFRDVAGVTMDLNGVEQIDFNALGGADNVW